MKALFQSGARITLVCLLAFTGAQAADKNGVSPQVISLPSGPGSIQGLGESFQPQLNSGSGTFSVPIQLPAGPTGFAPGLSIDYHTGQGNGILGIGWKLSGPTMVSRNMDHGLPFYVDGPNGVDDDFDGFIDNPGELDRFSGVNLEELVSLSDGSLRSENEGSFMRYRRVGDGWTAQEKSGVLHEFGTLGAARLENSGRKFAWLLHRTTDPNRNAAEYSYITDASSPGQRYLREVRWARPQAFYAAVFSYDSLRPDVYADFKSGFEIRTGLRLARIDVIAQGVPPSATALVGDFNGDGLPDSLIRRYELAYEEGSLVSRLSRVTMFGTDGVTALPAITFQYTDWTPPDKATSSFTFSSGDPSVGLESSDVELIDMNQDGLPDLLNATQGSHIVHFNRGMNKLGRLEWDTVGTLVGNAPGLNLGLPSVHLADHSADGESDFIHKVNDSTIECFLNSGQGSWSAPLSLGNTDTWPRWPFENTGSRTLDTDHNRLHDILFTGENSYRLWMLMPGGRYGREVPLPVLSDGTQAFRFEDAGARIADVNGDRISDLAWVQSNQVVYWASCGRGVFDGPIFLEIDGGLFVSEIPRVVLADINGDALSDLVLIRPAASPSGIQYFVNKGIAGFDARRTILGLPSEEEGDTTRCADMNGNGSVDFLISNGDRDPGTREQFLDFVPGVRPNLLTRIDNGLGSVTTLTYESSVDQMIRARDAGNPWETTMPNAVPVVARIVESDSRGNEFVREFTYRNPHFDSDKQEFRGFTHATGREIGDDSAPTSVTVNVFDNGTLAHCRKGMVLSQETADPAGSRFERMENAVTHRLVQDSPGDSPVCFAFNETVDTFVFEQTDTPVQLRAEYQYDNFGNTVRENRLGIFGESGDEQFVETEFAYDFVNWRMDRVARSTTKDVNGAKVAEDLFTYDLRGNLSVHRRWLDIGDRFVLAVRNEYDAFGNVVRMFDANGHSRSVVYDDALHTFPVTELIHLLSHDLSMSAEYDMALGTVLSAVEFSGTRTEYQYDSLARLIELRRPGGARTNYEYEFGNPVSRVSTRVLETLEGGETLDTHAYFDGLGRKLGSKLAAENNQWRFADVVSFNSRKLTRQRWLSYFTATPDFEPPDPSRTPYTLFYDAQGRAVRTVNPDGTESRMGYDPLVQHRFDENDAAGAASPTSERSDGLGRLIEVTERNGTEEYHTRYAWNTLGDLIETLDSQGNRKTLTYDSLRRKVSMNDPDRGVATFQHDDVGNLLSATDARGQRTVLSYDEANRLVAEDHIAQGAGSVDPIDVRWVYDIPSQNVDSGDGTTASATFTSARIAAVFDGSGEEHFSYDSRGNSAWIIKRIRDPQLGVLGSYKTAFAYDIMDRLTDVYYPDNDHCRYSYNTASLLERIDGGPSGQVVMAAAAYQPNGKPAHVVFGNGVTTTNEYDARERLSRLRTVSPLGTELTHYDYDFDAVANIVGINDLRPFDGPGGVPADSPRRNSQRFEYDDLYRLTRARYTPTSPDEAALGTISYTYDRIGNMLSQVSDNPKSHLGELTYGGGRLGREGRLPGASPGPHALTSSAAGGVYAYDDNGNMVNVEGATLTWDYKDRMVRYQKADVDARYGYDFGGRRVTKLVSQGGRTDETIYANRYFEYRPNRAPIKYVFGGPTRLAQVTDTLDPSRPRVQRMWLFEGFNLVTVAVQSLQSAGEVFGQGSRVYEWTGNAYQEVVPEAFVPVASPLWVEVPTSRIAAARGMYEPSTDAVVLPPGQTLFAWPRLEPLIPSEHLLTADFRIQAHDPQRPHWSLTDPFLPVNVSNGLRSYDATGAIWLTLDSPTQLVPAANETRATTFYHNDHLGSSGVITDQEGKLLQEVAYFPFGEVRHSHDPGIPFHQPYGFTGKEQDIESELHYFEARYLSARVGRFASVDPKYVGPDSLSPEGLVAYLAQPQDLNLYAYSRNNPMRYTDPSGLGIFEWWMEEQVYKPARAMQAVADEVWVPWGDDELDVGKSLKVAQGALEITVGAVSCVPTGGAGCVMAAHGVDVIASRDNDRTYTAKAITAVTGSETAGDVGDVIAGVGVGGAGLVAKGLGKAATKIPGAAVNPFATTARMTAPVAKAEAGVAVSTTSKAAPRAQTLSGVGPYKATGSTGAQQSQYLKNATIHSRTNARTAGQTQLADDVAARATRLERSKVKKPE